MNKLRTVSVGGGSVLVLATAWAVLTYGGDGGIAYFLLAGVLALAVIALPRTLAQAKLAIYNVGQWWENREGYSFERGSIYRSAEKVEERDILIDDVAARLEDESDYDAVRRDEFPEGPGLTATHAGFHNTFFRITRAGQVVVTGASKRSQDFAQLLEENFGLTMERTAFNPFLETRPVSGAPRVFLGLFLVALVLVGVGSIGAGAHQTSAYNPAEKVVLVGFDVRTDMPGVDADQTRLEKASFLVGIVEEEAVEIQWEQNSTGRIQGHAQEALYASGHADRLLNVTIRRGDSADRERAMKIRSDLRNAEADVATALETRNRGNVSSKRLSQMRKALQDRSENGTR